MKITNIEQQKNNDKRFSIFVDNEFAFGVTDVDVLFYKLNVDEEISEEKINKIKNDIVIIKAREIAFKYIGFKARTEQEVKTKLSKYDFTYDIILDTLNLLKSYGYIDDIKYTEDFFKEKINFKKYGTYRIKNMLYEKGIDKEVIEKVLENQSDNVQVENATYLLEKKYKNVTSPDYKKKQKIYGFLQRKGYSFNIIKEAYSIYFEEDDFYDDYR